VLAVGIAATMSAYVDAGAAARVLNGIRW